MLTKREFKDKYMKNIIDGNLIDEKYAEYFKENAKVGDGATVCFYSDAEAYTIIKRTKNTLTLRRCKAILSPDFKPKFVAGGFCGTVINQHEQSYSYEEDENGAIIKAYWSKAKKGFFWQGLHVIAGRHEFYDYNY